MEKINRAKLRGKPLDRECYKAKYYTQNGITMCFGRYAEFSDEEIGDIDIKCLNCKAYHDNVSDNWLLVAGVLLFQNEEEQND